MFSQFVIMNLISNNLKVKHFGQEIPRILCSGQHQCWGDVVAEEHLQL